MAQQQAMCVNSECGQYNKVVMIGDGENLTCLGCGRDLKIVTGSANGSGSGRASSSANLAMAIGGILVALLLLAAVWKMRPKPDPYKNNGGTFQSDSHPGDNNKGNQPEHDSGITPSASNDALMYFERSGLSWITPAAEEFGKTHDGAKIVLNPIGSYEGKQKILEAKETSLPVIWNPGESYWIGKLSNDWEKSPQYKGANIIAARYDILRTHYVFVMWEDRARVFEAAMRQKLYRNHTWRLIYTIATQGWSAVGGPASWGKLKLVHSNPMKSSSGLLTLGLILAEYRRDGHMGAETDNAGYMNLMKGIEGCVVEAPDTTSLTTKAFTEGGPEKVDMIVAYEQNALELIKKGQKNIRLIYSEPVLSVKFPAVVLKASWVSDKQAKIGDDFINYLLSPEVQKKAVDAGFYPVLGDLREDENQKLDIQEYKQAGFRLRPDSSDLTKLSISQRDLEGVQYTWNEWSDHPR